MNTNTRSNPFKYRELSVTVTSRGIILAQTRHCEGLLIRGYCARVCVLFTDRGCDARAYNPY